MSYLFYDINYGSEFEINSKDFPEGYIPRSTVILRLKVNNINVNDELRLKQLKSDRFSYTMMCAYFYDHFPSDNEARNEYGYKDNELMEWNSKEEDLIYHENFYTFAKAYTATYLVIKTNLLIDINYLSVLVSKKTRRVTYLKDIQYNDEFILDSQTLENYKPPFTFYLRYKDEGKQTIKIKLNNDLEVDDMFLILNLFNADAKDINYLIESRKLYQPVSIDYDNKFNKKVYTYTYDKLDDSVILISISIQSEQIFDYCSILVSKTNSKSIIGLNLYFSLALFLLIFL